MSEIWNLSTLCRCCHADGYFKSLNLTYQGKENVEIYENMLKNTLGITISRPQLEASYTICEDCIIKLRDAADFKTQVLTCEQKFKEYCENEQFFSLPDVKIEDETEASSCHSNDDSDNICDNDDDGDDNKKVIENTIKDVKQEHTIEIDMSDNVAEVKEEKPENTTIEVPEINSAEINKPLEVENKTTKDNNKTPDKKQKTRNDKKAVKKLNKTSQKEIKTKHKPYFIQETIGNVSKYSCKECGASFNTIQLIGTHLEEHRVIFKCEYCPKVLNSLKILLGHIKRHEKRQRAKFHKVCNRCPRVFYTKDSFDEHTQLHLSHNRNPICDICKKRFKNKRILSIHINLHFGTNKKVLCDICGWGFNDKTNLRAHINAVHLKLKPFVCKLCNKAYPTKRAYREHMAKHLGKEEIFSCNTCNWKSHNEKKAQIHCLSHKNKYMCKFCPEIFNDPKSRRQHVSDCHGFKFTCSICGLGLSSQHCLNRHLEIHDGIKKFDCKICGIKFSQKACLTRHNMRIHGPESNDLVVKTKCEICKRSFRNIEVHLERHRVRNFKCEICGQSYASNSTLNRHKAQKHFGRSYNCEVCNKKYLQKTKLNTHMRKVHGIKVENKDEKQELMRILAENLTRK